MNAVPVNRPQSPAGTGQLDPRQHLMQFATGYVISSALWVAAELNVADHLKNGPKPVSELASLTKSNEDALFRILRVLAMVGIFAESQPRHFALTPAAELLRTDVKGSMRDMAIWIMDPLHFRIAGELLHSVKTGDTTIEYMTGKPAFEVFAGDPVEFERFHRAMTAMSEMVIYPVLDVYDFSPYSTVVDVAGGHGFVLCEILRRHPMLNGVLFDLADVTIGADQRIKQLGLNSRCRTVGGDFFQSVPEGGDLYVMKNIIHDWDDSKAQTILRNCARVLKGKTHGRVVLLELVVPAGNAPHMSKIIDVEMLYFTGGRERTEEQYAELFAGAGLRLTRILPTASPYSVIEAEVV